MYLVTSYKNTIVAILGRIWLHCDTPQPNKAIRIQVLVWALISKEIAPRDHPSLLGWPRHYTLFLFQWPNNVQLLSTSPTFSQKKKHNTSFWRLQNGLKLYLKYVALISIIATTQSWRKVVLKNINAPSEKISTYC